MSSALFLAQSQALAPPYGGNDASTRLLIHADITPLGDSSISGHVINSYTSTVSGAAYVFGGSSIERLSGTGPMLSVGNNADFSFGTDDFCVEVFIKVSSFGDIQLIFAKRVTTSDFSPVLLWINAATGSLRCFITSSGSAWNIANDAVAGVVSANMWQHIALFRRGSQFFCSVGGVVTLVATSSAAVWTNSAALCFGGQPAGATYPLLGYMDEIRISKGAARYPASNFIPPSRPFT